MCPAFCDPLDSSLPVSSVHGIFQARILAWVAIFSSRGIFPTQELNLCLLCLLHCGWILYPLSHKDKFNGWTCFLEWKTHYFKCMFSQTYTYIRSSQFSTLKSLFFLEIKKNSIVYVSSRQVNGWEQSINLYNGFLWGKNFCTKEKEKSIIAVIQDKKKKQIKCQNLNGLIDQKHIINSYSINRSKYIK